MRLLSTLVALVGLTLLGVHGSRTAFSQGNNTELVILSTGSQHGELAPCG
jgi:hypothetical protein